MPEFCQSTSFKPFDTPEDYAAAPPLKLPWRSRYYDYVMTEASFRCGCGEPLHDVRGFIVDGQEMIELAVAGVCRRCHLIVPVTLMFNPTKGWALQHKGGDRWETVVFERSPGKEAVIPDRTDLTL